MPLYVYQCRACHWQTELLMRVADRKDTLKHTCKVCGCGQADQIIVPPNFESWSDGRYFEHLSPKGETFHDKSHYRAYLKQHGLSERGARRGMPGQEV
jgi:putative FmdB family regulatory protein